MSQQIAIIGAGNVGLGLAHIFSENGFKIKLGSRHLKTLLTQITKVEICSISEAVSDSDITLLTVPDSAITRVCESFATQFKKGSIVLHCSGVLSSEALLSAQTQGCLVASAHPLNTFPNPIAAVKLLSQPSHNTTLYCEGDANAIRKINSVFSKIGFNPITISAAAKPLYHAACVFACNYLTVLMDLSLQTAEAAKLDRNEFWNSIQPLVQSTLHNIDSQDTASSLSGPIARGEFETVQNHIQNLGMVSDDLRDSYINMAAHALRLAKKNDKTSTEKLTKLDELVKLIPNKS